MERLDFDHLKNEFSNRLGFEIASQESLINPFLSLSQLHERNIILLNSQWDLFYASIQRGMELLAEESLSIKDSSKAASQLLLELEDWEESFYFSEQSANFLYGLAKQTIERKELTKALDLLLLGTALAPGYFEIWLALGTVEQELGHIERALSIYSQASLLNPMHILPYLFRAQCYNKLCLANEAKEALEIANSLLEESPDFSGLSAWIKHLKADLGSK